MFNLLASFIDRIIHPLQVGQRRQKKVKFSISKRQKFIASVVILSAMLFFSEYVFSISSIFLSLILALTTDIFLYVALFNDLRESFSPQPFFLPFLCSLSFGLFFFLTPTRFISRIVLTTLYAISIYALFLSENIFLVGSIRNIALLNSARIVTFVISLLSYFFISNTILSFRLNFFPTTILLGFFSFLFVTHSIWIYTLEKSINKYLLWSSIITLCIFELICVLWFWPTSTTVLALFLTIIFYTFISLTHMWLDRRLFQGIFWEYSWIVGIACLILIWFTNYQG